MSAPTARAQARERTTEQIKDIARRRLAVDGPNLSLRAVARDLGVVSSAVYRYFASRDDLLAALVHDAGAALGEAVEDAEAGVPRRDVAGRWAAVCRSTRRWALAHPHEFLLVHGRPVAEHAASGEAAARTQRALLVALSALSDGLVRGVITAPGDRLPRAVRAELEAAGRLPGYALPAPLLARALGAWAQLCGAVCLELSGNYFNLIDSPDDFFDLQVRTMARHLGIFA